MPKTILFAGYTKIEHITKLRLQFPDDTVFACAYKRPPATETKMKYLTHFDLHFDLTQISDVRDLKTAATQISCVTCTQERDMPAYIESLKLTEKITESEAEQYLSAIDKQRFKESLQSVHSSLVPGHHEVTNDLLDNLESLTYPQIIKPSGLAGSIMIRVVHSPADFLTHYQAFGGAMQEIAKNNYAKDITIITEDFIDGPQYSVNAYIDAFGKVTLCPIVRVVTPQEMGISDTYSVFQYTTNELTKTQYDRLLKSVQTVATHFNLKSTSAHFDSVLQNDQWKFFEVGLRIGGNRQKLYEYSHGMDHLRNDIQNRLGKIISVPIQKKSVCIVQKASEINGVLREIYITRNIKTEESPLIIEDKLAKICQEVKPVSLGGGTITRHFVIGDEQADVLKTSQSLFKNITLINK